MAATRRAISSSLSFSDRAERTSGIDAWREEGRNVGRGERCNVEGRGDVEEEEACSGAEGVAVVDEDAGEDEVVMLLVLL